MERIDLPETLNVGVVACLALALGVGVQLVQDRAPFAWVAQHEHVLELLVVSLWSVTVPMGLGCHPLTQWAFVLVAALASVEAHAGYRAGPLRLCFIGRVLGPHAPVEW